MEQEKYQNVPLIPVVRQPKGLEYFLGTWSGRLQIINAVVFAIMVWREPSSIMMPSLDFVRAFGSKSIADIANGEYWRYVTPIFVHIGGLHFFFNAMGLYYIGYQLEHILGARWFLLLYLLTGIMGNLSSCLYSLSPSAGASGALFGLLGAGFRLEGLVSDAFDKMGEKNRPRKRIYTGMALSNIVLGLLIPVIDNAAHIGGLISGWLLTEAMLRIRQNKLRPTNPKIAWSIFAGLSVFTIVAVARTSDKVVVVSRFYKAAIGASSAPEAYQMFSEALRVRPLDEMCRLHRGKLLLQNGEIKSGISDVEMALRTGRLQPSDIVTVVNDLKLTGHNFEAELVKKIAVEMSGTEI
jgi:membrane associated rhomboid family serine protease